jgi:hypothetical protein
MHLVGSDFNRSSGAVPLIDAFNTIHPVFSINHATANQAQNAPFPQKPLKMTLYFATFRVKFTRHPAICPTTVCLGDTMPHPHCSGRIQGACCPNLFLARMWGRHSCLPVTGTFQFPDSGQIRGFL